MLPTQTIYYQHNSILENDIRPDAQAFADSGGGRDENCHYGLNRANSDKAGRGKTIERTNKQTDRTESWQMGGKPGTGTSSPVCPIRVRGCPPLFLPFLRKVGGRAGTVRMTRLQNIMCVSVIILGLPTHSLGGEPPAGNGSV